MAFLIEKSPKEQICFSKEIIARKRHIGTNIMKFIEDFGKQNGVDFIFLGCDLENTSAKEFYKKIGYEQDYGFYKYL